MLAMATGSCTKPAEELKTSRLNILLVVADDLGFTDLGAFGSEIETPNLDSLATNGLIFSSFHASPNCSPTRAMLMSGTDNHIAGFGSMVELLSENQKDQPGYEGYLNSRIATMPELYKAAGFNTFMAGKWHLGKSEEASPRARGFDRSFALMDGGAGAFADMLHFINPTGDPARKAFYREEGVRIDQLPDEFYSTKSYTEKLIEYIEEGRESGKPFLGYLAYTAPHWPLQAPRKSIEKYQGKYDGGYDDLRERRLDASQTLGLTSMYASSFPRLLSEQPWDALSQQEKARQARVMEVYAAMIDDMDHHMGRLIAYLKSIDEYENTVIFFMSDNGPEGHAHEINGPGIARTAENCCDNSIENIGNADSYVWTGPNWAQASNAPSRMYKGFTGQGGVLVPAFIHYPGLAKKGEISDALLHAEDVLPTLLELSEITHPGDGEFMGRTVVPMRGKSFAPILNGDVEHVRSDDDFLAWELFGKRAVRQGDWKATFVPSVEGRDERFPVNVKVDQWQLFNLRDDPGETLDLSNTHPEKQASLIQFWDRYARETGVILPQRPIRY